MATIKITQRNKALSNGEYPIYLRITKNRKTKFISLKLSCNISEWNESKSEFRKNYINYKQFNSALNEIRSRGEKIVTDSLAEGEDFTLEEFETLFLNYKTDKRITVDDFWQEHVEDLVKSGRTGNARFFKDSKTSFYKFLGNKVIYFKDITPLMLDKYEVYLRSNDNIDSGIAVKMRALRALYNDAIKKGYASKENYPFSTYKISKLKSSANKRSLSIENVYKIIDQDLTKHSELINARNYFVFSYFTRGMNFNDMMHLSWSNIVEDKITYIRGKTKRRFVIKILEPVSEILYYYKSQKRPTKYVFPILLSDKLSPIQLENRKGKTLKKFNKDLKALAIICDIEEKITSYVARHSFANNLKQRGTSTDLISEAMGHQNIVVTQAYLRELENDTIDDAMEVLVRVKK